MTTRVGAIKIDFDGDARGLEATHHKVVAMQRRTETTAGKMGEALKKAAYNGVAATDKLTAAVKKTGDAAGQSTSKLQAFAKKADEAASPKLEKGIKALGGAFGALGGQAAGAVGAVGDVMGLLMSGMGKVGIAGAAAAGAVALLNWHIEKSEKAAKKAEEQFDRTFGARAAALKAENDASFAMRSELAVAEAGFGLTGSSRVRAEQELVAKTKIASLDQQASALMKEHTRLGMQLVAIDDSRMVALREQVAQIRVQKGVVSDQVELAVKLAEIAEREASARERAARALDVQVQHLLRKISAINAEAEVLADLEDNPPVGPQVGQIEVTAPFQGGGLMGPRQAPRSAQRALQDAAAERERGVSNAETARQNGEWMGAAIIDSLSRGDLSGMGRSIGGALGTAAGGPIGAVVGGIIGDLLFSLPMMIIDGISAAITSLGNMLSGLFGDQRVEAAGGAATAAFAALVTPVLALTASLIASVAIVTFLTAGLWLLFPPAVLLVGVFFALAAGALLVVGTIAAIVALGVLFFELSKSTESYQTFQDLAARQFDKLVRVLEPFWEAMLPATVALGFIVEALMVFAAAFATGGSGPGALLFAALREVGLGALNVALAFQETINALGRALGGSDGPLGDFMKGTQPLKDAIERLTAMTYEDAQLQARKDAMKMRIEEQLRNSLDRNTDALKARELTNVPSGYRVPLYDSERPDGGGAGGVPIMPPQRTGETNVFQGPVTFVLQGNDVAKQMREQAIRQRGAPTAAPRRRAPTPGN
jgi:hypothetical protein